MTNTFSASSFWAPQNMTDLKDLITDLNAKEEMWIPTGIGSRLNWGPCMNQNITKVSIKEFNRIIDYSKEDMTITVEGGIVLSELQEVLAKNNQWLAIDWPWGTNTEFDPKSSGSIGGVIARGLSGSLRHRYMGVRDQLIGIGLIRSDGIAAKAGGKVVKNVAGYDLMRILCGSWGSLALITEITLRTQPIKKHHIKILIKGSLDIINNFRIDLINLNLSLEYCDWISNNDSSWSLEIGLASLSEEAVSEQIKILIALSNKYKLKSEKKFWEGPLLDLGSTNQELSTNEWLVRISIPPAMIPDLLKSNQVKRLIDFNWRFSSTLGVGDGWLNNNNLKETFSITNQIKSLREKVLSLSGQLIILNQPNLEKQRLPAWLDAKAKPVIESVKQQFDPKNQLSPGKVPGIKA